MHNPLNQQQQRRSGSGRSVTAFKPLESLESRVLMSTVPSDPFFNTDNRHANIDSPEAWDITTGSSGVVVAVLDTGVDINHPDLFQNIFVNPGEVAADGIDNDNNGFIDDVSGWDFITNDNEAEDTDGHGTHVAGILGAVGNNTLGVTGQAWNIKILPVKVITKDGGPFEGIAAGVDYVTSMRRAGHNIVAMNLSLGGTTVNFPSVLNAAIRAAGEADILSVVAAGNDATDIDRLGDFPSGLSLNIPEVLTVGGTNPRDDSLYDWTNFGAAKVQVAAPGVDIVSTWPTALDPDGYNAITGTSMATPVVAGIAALIKSYQPGASAVEIKQAIINGSEVIGALVRQGRLAPLVSTGGRVNAYGALRAAVNKFALADTSTNDTYAGRYGLEGSIAAPPDYVNLDITGGSLEQGGIAGVYRRSSSPITVDINFTDDQTHRVSLVMLGIDKAKRSQHVTLYDAATGMKLAPVQTATDMRNDEGAILSYDLTGHVRLVIQHTKGDSAVLHDVLFDAAPTDTSAFAGVDSQTQGDWRQRYGSEGAFIVGYHTSLPFAAVSGATADIIAPVTRKKQGLVLPGNNFKNRTLGYLRTPSAMTIDANFTDGKSHRLTVYAADFDRQDRAQMFELRNVDTGEILDRRVLEDFRDGKYISWDVTGHVTLTVVRMTGPDAVVSGIFVDASPSSDVRFIGQDTTTHGAWTTDYGSAGAYIIGNHEQPIVDQQAPLPSGVTLEFPDSTTRIVDDSSGKRGALRKYNQPRDRIVAHRESFYTTTVRMNVNRSLPMRVSIYAADVENARRAQAIEVYSRDGALLARTEMVNFRDGAYATFDIRGDVDIRIINMAGPGKGAIVNGIFFD